MVGKDLYGHMCVFLAGGLRTSEGIVYLSITLRMRSCLRPWGGSDAGREEGRGWGCSPRIGSRELQPHLGGVEQKEVGNDLYEHMCVL